MADGPGQRRVIIAAGGTGGHMFPAAAFAQEMRARGWLVTLVTDVRGRRYSEGFPADAIEDVPAATFQGRNPLHLAMAGLKIWRGIGAAGARLRALTPKLVAGFGGYPSLPMLWAARARHIPILIHEQNAVLGRVNRHFAGQAAAIASGFERLDRLPPAAAARHHCVGNPVRAEIIAVRAGAYPQIPAGGEIVLLATGGSQGARLFGQILPKAVIALDPKLRARLRIIQQVREEQMEAVRRVYHGAGVAAEVAPFFKDMAQRLSQSHLVMARAGASSVTELLVVGRPAILIPLAIATDDHQSANAEAMTQVGAADVIAESALTTEGLSVLLAERLSDAHGLSVRAAAARAAGHPGAAGALADLAERVARP